jgi:DNA processing protein
MLCAMEAALFRAALGRLPGLSAPALLGACQQAGSLEALAAAKPGDFVSLGWSATLVERWRKLDPAQLEADLALCNTRGIQCLAACDAGYPALLRELVDAPALLYVRGAAEALSTPQLAIVGSRNPTSAGRSIAREFAQHFAQLGLTVTSGLALGIDTAAHEGALAGDGLTVAVCGTGLDRLYPAANARLAERILAQGAIVGELPPGSPALKQHFPQRNRLIAGISVGTLVVEAARESGSLITARRAGDYGRDVFAIPGSIHSPQSKGCHELIRSGAKLVDCAEHVLEELQIPLRNQLFSESKASLKKCPLAGEPLDKEHEILLHALGFAPASADQLVARTGLPSESIASMLLLLEMQGQIEVQPGGRYCRAARLGEATS